MKITIITACYNSIATIRDAMESVWRQIGAGDRCRCAEDVLSLEHIVIDGGSTDGTVDVIKEFESRHCSTSNLQPSTFTFRWLSERDHGLYDALNKGIKMATGDVVGICNADDILADDDVVAKIAEAFSTQGSSGAEEGCVGAAAIDAVYADIRFVRGEVHRGAGVQPQLSSETPASPTSPLLRSSALTKLRSLPTVRYCTGRYFRKWMFRFATFPAHPSTFVRRECFERYGLYSLDYPICADFEMMLRLFVKHNITARYLPLCTHVMRMGGASTGGIRSNIAINNQDLRALRAHGIWSCLPLIYLKYFAKVWGFVRKGRGKKEK